MDEERERAQTECKTQNLVEITSVQPHEINIESNHVEGEINADTIMKKCGAMVVCDDASKFCNAVQTVEAAEKRDFEEDKMAELQRVEVGMSHLSVESRASSVAEIYPSRIDIKDLEAVVQAFSGDDNLPVRLWIVEFETACSMLGVPDERLWIYAKRLLSGSAKEYFLHQGAIPWGDLRKQLMDVFGEECTRLEIGEQLKKCKQAKDESAFHYFIRMCSIARQADLEDCDVIKHIVCGLRDGVGITSSLFFCQTLKELRQKVIQLDKIRPLVLLNEAGSTNKATVREVRCYNCRQMGHISTECKKPKRPIDGCFTCGERGHQHRDCPKRRMKDTVAATAELVKEEDDVAAIQLPS
ncbi:uncharacterized protein LOC115621550 [Scaptodrosophila lebanonensis]|nr:uncharacterized protein LOC115621550 [Scaptodrosophila lebanonensis]